MFNFKTSKVNFKDCLGKGAFGSVYPYQRNLEDKKFVIKHLTVSHRMLPIAIGEIALGFRCEHPNVIPVKGFDLRPHGINNPRLLKTWENFTEWDVIIKLPRMKESLRHRIERYQNNNQSFSEEEVLKLFSEIVSGLVYLHKNKISHRDLKPDNILFDTENTALLSDLGLAKFTEDETGYDLTEMAGTRAYLAPEVSAQAKLQKGDLYQAEVWSLGIVILQVCSLPRNSIGKYSSKSAEEKENRLKQDINQLNYSQFLKELLEKMLRSKPQDRITITDLWNKLNEKLTGIVKTTSMVVKDQSILASKEKSQEDNNKSESTTVKSPMQVEESKGELDSLLKMAQITQGRLKPGEFREDEIDDRETSVLSVRNELRNDYGELFEFEADITEQSLKIARKESIEARNISDQILGGLLEQLTTEVVGKNCKRFKTLNLSLPYCSEIKGVSFAKLFGSNQRLELTNLKLNLDGTSVNKSGLKELATQISSKLPSLEDLTIHFPHQVNGEGVANLAAKIFPSLANLKQIELMMRNPKISDDECNKIATHITGLEHLEKLRIDLNGCSKLTATGFEDLFVPIVSKCKNLNHLDLDFTNCPKLSVSDFKEPLPPAVHNLHHLKLNFSECSKIRDDGVIRIANHVIPNLKNLKYLNLNYSQCKVTDDGLFLLINQICLNIPSLEHLLFGFRGSSDNGGMITGEGLLTIVDPIKSHLRTLESLQFDFEYCNQSVKEIIPTLEDSLKVILKNVSFKTK